MSLVSEKPSPSLFSSAVLPSPLVLVSLSSSSCSVPLLPLYHGVSGPLALAPTVPCFFPSNTIAGFNASLEVASMSMALSLPLLLFDIRRLEG